MSENRGVPMYPNNSDAAKENANRNLPVKAEKVEKVIEGNATVKKPLSDNALWITYLTEVLRIG